MVQSRVTASKNHYRLCTAAWISASPFPAYWQLFALVALNLNGR